MKIYLFIIFNFLTIIKTYYIPYNTNLNETFNNFSFGSCFLGYLSDRNDIFQTINDNQPELWIWTGDAAYIDKINLKYFSSRVPLDLEYAENMFQKVKNEKCIFYISIILRKSIKLNFIKLIKSKITVINILKTFSLFNFGEVYPNDRSVG